MSTDDVLELEEIAVKARRSISKYCMEECHSLCCRKGELSVTEKELDLIAGPDSKAKKESMLNLNKINGKFMLDLDHDCPCFKDNKCAIHSNKDRPKMCKEFPVFVREGRVIFTKKCPAVQGNKMYPYMHMLSKKGYHFS